MNKYYKYKHIALSFLLGILCLSTATHSYPEKINAKADDSSSDKKEEMVNIKADDSSSDEKKGITVFKGIEKKVEIERDNGDYLYANIATVYRNVETNEVIKIEADGNVEMKEGEKIATCQHALINEEEDWIEMTGSAKVVEKDTVTEANKITYYRKDGRLETKGNSKFKFKMKSKENKENKEKSEGKSEEKGTSSEKK